MRLYRYHFQPYKAMLTVSPFLFVYIHKYGRLLIRHLPLSLSLHFRYQLGKRSSLKLFPYCALTFHVTDLSDMFHICIHLLFSPLMLSPLLHIFANLMCGSFGNPNPFKKEDNKTLRITITLFVWNKKQRRLLVESNRPTEKQMHGYNQRATTMKLIWSICTHRCLKIWHRSLLVPYWFLQQVLSSWSRNILRNS